MCRTTFRIAALILVLAGVDPSGHLSAAPDSITKHQAGPHGMRYYLALPTAWKPGGSWPVLVAIPDAAREFEANLRRFVTARGDRPYILVAPEVLTCGGARSRTPDHYTYTRAEWMALRPQDDFRFDDEGLIAVLAEVHRAWGGAPKAVLTGWEAGGHLVWAEALRAPQRWRAVAPVAGAEHGPLPEAVLAWCDSLPHQ